jgi:hypothetical protein
VRLRAGHPGLRLWACHQQLLLWACHQYLLLAAPAQRRWAVEGLGRSVHGF